MNNYIITFENILNLDETYKEKIRQWRNLPFVRNKMINSHIISRDEHKKFLSSLEQNSKKRYYLVFYKMDPIGVVDYQIYENKSLEFGFYLINENLSQVGFGAVFEYSILNHAFFDLKMNVVVCNTLVENKKVINLHRRFGFKEKEVHEIKVEKKEETKELLQQIITKEEWVKVKPNIEKAIKIIVPVEKIGEFKNF